jgi:hypothetical protein
MFAPAGDIRKKRRSGIPTGNAGEYFVMGELLRRGFDAQLADRNTQGYDLLVGMANDKALHKVQIKSVRSPPWYVKNKDFDAEVVVGLTIYVLIGPADGKKPVRFFITRNCDLVKDVHCPPKWKDQAFMPMKAIEQYEDQWETLRSVS